MTSEIKHFDLREFLFFSGIFIGVFFQCDKVFKTPLATYRHKQSVHDGKRYNCTECEYVGKRSDDLKRHSQSQHEGFKYVCPECNYVVTTPSGLMNHKRKIHDGIKYTCDLCDKYSGASSNLHCFIYWVTY